MNVSPNTVSSNSVYVKITPSGIIANLVQYGTSMITSGHNQNLLLDPGTFSVDLDGYIFNATVNSYHFNSLTSSAFFSHFIGLDI